MIKIIIVFTIGLFIGGFMGITTMCLVSVDKIHIRK